LLKKPSEIWNEMGHGQSSGRTVNFWQSGLIVASKSSSNSPELLIQLSGTSTKQLTGFSIRGASIEVQTLSFDDALRSWLVISLDPSQSPSPFFALCDFLADSLPKAGNPEDDLGFLRTEISRWQSFWQKENVEFTREKQLGLLGELLAIRYTFKSISDAIKSWTGPSGHQHDFTGILNSVEVKTSARRTGPLTHEISSIEQLQAPASGDLLLLSVRVSSDPIGEISLEDLISDIKSKFQMIGTNEIDQIFDLGVAANSYDPTSPLAKERFTLIDQIVYRVEGDFPRISSKIVPGDDSIFDVKYSIDLSNFGHLISKEQSEIELN
jgi:hypothetical protein